MVEKILQNLINQLKNKYKNVFSDVAIIDQMICFYFLDLKIADDFYEETLKRGYDSTAVLVSGNLPTVKVDLEQANVLFSELDKLIYWIMDWKSRTVRYASKKAYSVANPDDSFINSLPKKTWQGCPGIAVTKNGRIFVSIYTGGEGEPHPDNFTALYYSDDDGNTWSKPVFVTFSSREFCVHTVDMQPFINKEGKLQVFWTQEDYLNNSRFVNNFGCYFYDTEHSSFMVEVEDPDAEVLKFSEPKLISKGFMRNKPIELSDGGTLYFCYDHDSDKYGFTKSYDGKKFERIYGGKKLPSPFDETMGYQLKDGRIKVFARTSVDYLAETISKDFGKTWTDAKMTDIKNSNTRFYVGRTPSGKILLINNDQKNAPKLLRTNLTVYLSDDDGKTFSLKRLIDDREGVSYPDVDYHDGKIYLIYDRGRDKENKLILSIFTEDEILENDFVPAKKYVLDLRGE